MIFYDLHHYGSELFNKRSDNVEGSARIWGMRQEYGTPLLQKIKISLEITTIFKGTHGSPDC